ncbi:MAG: arylsulfatase A-like enzyme [Chlamydiales bacterium]|jgi:arylsulfatase A-like enzyme
MRLPFFFVALLTISSIGSPSLAQESKPNIVFILVDNWGWGDVSIQGSPTQTPRVDRLAHEGLRFTNYNVENQCTPSRSAIHTGRLPIRSGTQAVPPPGSPGGMCPWEYTIAELLSDAGYATAAYGKWHLGDINGRLPNDQGYDEWWGITESAFMASFTNTPQFDAAVCPIPRLWTGRKGQSSKPLEEFDLENRALVDRIAVEKTIAFMKSRAVEKKPFFVYAALTQLHPPFLPHPDFKGKSRAGAYADIQMEVDHHVGMLLDAIEDAGVGENTIVVLTGDNAAGNETDEGGSNGPWRGGLSTAYEGGTRTVGMVRWPGRIKPRVSDEIVACLDWMPTLANLIGEGQRVPTDRPVDGVDQSSFLLGSEKSAREHVVTYVGDKVFAVKWRTLKVHFYTAESTFSPIVQHTFPQVYDVKNEPGETRELWKTEGYSHAWVMRPVMKILGELAASQEQYPNIRTGQEFTGYK